MSAVALLDAYEYLNQHHYPSDDHARLRRFAVMARLLELSAAGGDGNQVCVCIHLFGMFPSGWDFVLWRA